MRGERCACRGWIQVEDETDECEVRDTVRDHNASDQHRTYMAAGNPPASRRAVRFCPGTDAGCGRHIRPDEALCYSCARRSALGRERRRLAE